MHKDKTADKPTWAPNEAPASRWVGFFFAGFFAMTCIQLALMGIADIWKMDGAWAWLPGTLCPLASFALTFVCLALLSKKICRTSVRDLVLGAGNGLDRRLCVKLCAAVALGSALESAICPLLFPDPTASTQLNSIGPVPILVNLVLCVALLWMQTTTEEILFRCPFLRAGGGNEIAPSAKVAIWGFISYVVFMLIHGSNPEVKAQTELVAILCALGGYLVAAVGMYAADVVYRTPLAGCAIHWMNNFISIALFCQAGSAVESGSVFWVTGAVSGPSSFVGTICLFVPVVAVMAVDARKRKAAQAAEV